MTKGAKGVRSESALERIPPHNLEAEQSVLGSMFLSEKAVNDVIEEVNVADFYRPAHAKVFQAIIDLADRNEPIDIITVANRLEDKGELEGVGGKPYLLTLTNVVPTAANAVHHAKIVRAASKMRALIRTGMEIQTLGYESAMDEADTAVSKAMSSIMGLAMSSKRGAMSLSTAMRDLLKQVMSGPADYISPPGLPWVHIKRGDLVILAAGTSVGKTMVSLDWADSWSEQYATAYLEYEMNEVSLAARITAKYTQLSMVEMDEGLEDDQMQTLVRAATYLDSRKLYVEAMRGEGTAELFAKIRRAASVGIRVVMVDHLGLIPFAVPQGMNAAKAIGFEITNKLKRLAVELDISIVLLCQLSREGQSGQGKDRFPTLRHLRDSGEIEQDADIVVMLHREARAADDPVAALNAREALMLPGDWPHDLIWMGVRKNRNGALGHEFVGAIPAHNLLFNYEESDPYAEVRSLLNAFKRPAPVVQPELA